jgi:lipopolysaccharide/colanic/teichoic acid biosynthesis glycosyltransferase
MPAMREGNSMSNSQVLQGSSFAGLDDSSRRIIPSRLGKRMLDLVGVVLGGVFLGPLVLVIALLIRLDSPGPVFFHQRRLGRWGEPFWMWKFRTMVVGSEAIHADFERLNEVQGGGVFKIRRDPRITRVGRLLRRASLDELPQLVNVLQGTMSLVGPRPLPLRDCTLLEEMDVDRYRTRLSVLPGLTGLWQVSGRSDLDARQMLELDSQYVENASVYEDVKIIARTVRVVLTGRGAY